MLEFKRIHERSWSIKAVAYFYWHCFLSINFSLFAGEYCIYQMVQCPAGFTPGYVYWDDDDNFNGNRDSGTLPNGEYDEDTEIDFCCKTDGDKDDPILLPSKSPFFLLAYMSPKCQMVKWAIATVEWIKFDTEHYRNLDDRGGAYPYDAGKTHPTIYYCYYRGEKTYFCGDLNLASSN